MNPDDERWNAAWEYGQQFDRTAILEPVISELRSIVGQTAVGHSEKHVVKDES